MDWTIKTKVLELITRLGKLADGEEKEILQKAYKIYWRNIATCKTDAENERAFKCWARVYYLWYVSKDEGWLKMSAEKLWDGLNQRILMKEAVA